MSTGCSARGFGPIYIEGFTVTLSKSFRFCVTQSIVESDTDCVTLDDTHVTGK